MFDMLTVDDLYNLHTSLGLSGQKIHATMMDGDQPVIGVFSDDWNVRAAACSELSETMYAVSAEITRREQAAAGSPILDVPRA